MSKLSMSLAAAITIAGAGEFNIEKFVKQSLIRNPGIKVNKVEVIGKKSIEQDQEWNAYMIMLDLSMGRDKKSVKVPEMIFVNEKSNLAAMTLIDLKSGRDLARSIKPEMPDSYYDDAHLISGKSDAKHKMVVFSDPQCPFCINFVPKMLEEAKKHPDKIAVYYYHMPLLRLHPVSDTLTRVMEVLQKRGKSDDAMKMYSLKINPRLKDEKKILAEVKKQLGIDIKPEEINKKEIREAVEADMEKGSRMMVRGTPSVYFDGKYDGSRSLYKSVLK